MTKVFVRCVAALFLLSSVGVHAAHITVFTASLDGDQANMGAGTGSRGKGAATMALNSDTSEFSWFIAWQNLGAPVTNGHFHGPAAPGQNGGVQVPFDFTSNPSIGATTLTSGQIDDLLAGLWYINVHTSDFPGGEIRGQVLAISAIPLPGAVWLFGSASLLFWGWMRPRT